MPKEEGTRHAPKQHIENSNNLLTRRGILKAGLGLGIAGLGAGMPETYAQTSELSRLLERPYEDQIKVLAHNVETFNNLDPLASLNLNEAFQKHTSLNIHNFANAGYLGQPQLTKDLLDAVEGSGPYYYIVDVSAGDLNGQITRGKFIGLNEVSQYQNLDQVDNDSGDKYIGGIFDGFLLGVTLHDYETEFGAAKAIVYHTGGLSHDQKWSASGMGGLIAVGDTSIFERPAGYVIEGSDESRFRLITQIQDKDRVAGATLRDEVVVAENSVGSLVSFNTQGSMSISDIMYLFKNFPKEMGNLPEDYLSIEAWKKFGKNNSSFFESLQNHALRSAYSSDYPYVIFDYQNGNLSSISEKFPQALENQQEFNISKPEDFLDPEQAKLSRRDLEEMPVFSPARFVTPPSAPKIFNTT